MRYDCVSVIRTETGTLEVRFDVLELEADWNGFPPNPNIRNTDMEGRFYYPEIMSKTEALEILVRSMLSHRRGLINQCEVDITQLAHFKVP